jgi:hypothetical protein
MRAGERAFIMDQLKERFGERFTVIEEFLSIHAKVTDITDDERTWGLNLFDSLVNPNIYIELSELYYFLETIQITDIMSFKVTMPQKYNGVFKYNGSIKYDGKVNTMQEEVL